MASWVFLLRKIDYIHPRVYQGSIHWRSVQTMISNTHAYRRAAFNCVILWRWRASFSASIFFVFSTKSPLASQRVSMIVVASLFVGKYFAITSDVLRRQIWKEWFGRCFVIVGLENKTWSDNMASWVFLLWKMWNLHPSVYQGIINRWSIQTR